jgi:16S rRNA (adenine1518-N6/adenine1519-N6)-dimethyltransferase
VSDTPARPPARPKSPDAPAARTAARRAAGGAPEEPTQPTLHRMRQFGVRPDRDLGQNFLIDSNILGVIGRLAELSERDVVLEIGGGLGVLSEYLAERVGHLHVVEIDERLRDALGDAVDRFANVTLHWGDALAVDLAGMRPRPTKVVANLPYGVATGALLRTIEELPTVTRWVAMVQREVGERLAAGPTGPGRLGAGRGGSGRGGPYQNAYGAPSVLAQLACDVRVARAIPRTVFHPVPNVDSVLVVLTRTGLAPSLALRGFVNAAFVHRRKTLARSLMLAESVRVRGGAAGDAHDVETVRAALVELGHPPDARAERLSPQDFRELYSRGA